jgi:predicted PurR-regulated permease PerM
MTSGFAGVVVVLWVLAFIVAVLWILMPFAVFGTKDLLKQLLREQKRTNDLLAAIGERREELPRLTDRP